VTVNKPAEEELWMEQTIGTAAGVVWTYLNKHGETNVTQLKKSVNLSPVLVNRAIGWLAREGKITEVQKGRTSNFKLTS
jgi:predicted transcriptional regulator